MDLTQLRYFLAIVEHKTVTRAAMTLHVAQPALTRQIKLLEQELGVELFVRHNRGVALTDEGAKFAPRVKQILETIDEVKREVMDKCTEPVGHLALGCTPTLTKVIVVEALLNFLTRYRKVSIDLQENVSAGLCSAVLNKTLDAAIVSTTVDEPYLHTTHLFKDPVWVVGPAGKLDPTEKVDIHTLASFPMLLTRRSQTTREIIERRVTEQGYQLNVIVEADSVQALQKFVVAGLGYSVAPWTAVKEIISSRSVSGSPIADFTIDRSLVRRIDRPESRALRELRQLICQEAAAWQSSNIV